MGRNARGEGEQLILQEQRGAPSGTVPVAGAVTRPCNETVHMLRSKITRFSNLEKQNLPFSNSQLEYYLVFFPSTLTEDHGEKKEHLLGCFTSF